MNISTLPFKAPRLNAYSLIEIGIALMIVGVLVGAVIKGRDMLEGARHISIVKDFQNIKRALCAYQDTYLAIPGDDSGANRFGADVQPGNGDLQITGQDVSKVWVHLHAAELWRDKNFPTSKLGGVYIVESDPNQQVWIVLAHNNDKGPILTPRQALRLKNKILSMDGDLSESDVVIDDGHHAPSACLVAGKLNLQNIDKVCIVRYKASDLG